MKREKPWYVQDPPNFECQKCGACCRRNGYVYFSKKEIQELAAHLELEVPEMKKMYGMNDATDKNDSVSFIKTDGACPFLLQNINGGVNCSVYHQRPRQCRMYPAWAEVLETRNSWAKHAEQCIGIGKGGKLPAVVNLRNLKEIDTRERAGIEALIDCNKHNRPDPNGECYSTKCIFYRYKSDQIDKDGCKIYIIAKKLEEMSK